MTNDQQPAAKEGGTPSGKSVAFDAANAFDELAADLAAVGSIAASLATSGSINAEVRSAFLGIANSLDGLSGRVNAYTEEFMARR